MKFNEGTIDDLINLDSDGEENNAVFKTIKRTGTLTQLEMPVFGDRTVIPQNLTSAVTLRKGDGSAPASKVFLQNTSASDHSELIFSLKIHALALVDDKGNIKNHTLNVLINVYDRTGTTLIGQASRAFNNKTNTPFAFQIPVSIPKANRSRSGYKFTIEKTSPDSENSKIKDTVSFQYWLEVKEEVTAYPRTAAVGFSILAHNEHTGGVPNFTSVVKGLLVKVPSNYNQPILANGEIDWRELELQESGEFAYTDSGYRLQNPGTGEVLLTVNPIIYMGVWDGNFVYSWTQNPVWVIYDLLTNTTYGLGIPEQNIDKFQFYKVAQYCDGVEPTTGKWYGVDGFSDGSYRYKPRNAFNSVKETLIGINEGIPVKERRFIFDAQITDQQQAFNVMNQVCAGMRALLIYAGGKLSLHLDMPDEVPVMIFNEANIQPNSVGISGVSESEMLTGVDTSYINPANHYKRETMRVDDAAAIKDLNSIENISSVDIIGVTRRSQAMRFSQYLLAASKFIRRKVLFRTDTSAINLIPGDLIALQQKVAGTAWGFGGRVSANGSIVGSSSRFGAQHANVTLEHFTSPGITDSTFTANTLPVGMRVFNNRNENLSLYILSNTDFKVTTSGATTYPSVRLNSTTGGGIGSSFNVRRFDTDYEATLVGAGTKFVIGDKITVTGNNLGGTVSTNDCTITVTDNVTATGAISAFTVSGTSISSFSNVASGADSIEVRALEHYNLTTHTWNTNFAWTSNTVPARGDSWTLGEVDPNNFYRDTTDKLFKVTSVDRDEKEVITINASEYIANVYTDSDTAINYTPVRYRDTFSPLVPPPTPEFTLTAVPYETPDGSIQTDLEISDNTNSAGYPLALKPVYEYAIPNEFSEIVKVIP